MRAALDIHKRTIVCASRPDDPRAGELRVEEIPNTERALRALVKRPAGPEGLAVCYEAGPSGYDPLRLLVRMGVAYDVVAPSLVPVKAGHRVRTDRRDAKKLLALYRAGALSFVTPPTPEQEGLRDLVRCRHDLIAARRVTASRSSCCAMATSLRARRPGRWPTAPGCATSASAIPTPTLR